MATPIQDIEKNILAFNRRLDTLARLLEGKSECVAVSLINGKFCIAANELTNYFNTAQATQAELSIIDSIKKIITYFKRISREKGLPSNEERKKIFLEICTKERMDTILKGKYVVPNGLCDKIAEKILEKKENLNTKNILDLSAQYKCEVVLTGAICAEFSSLYKDFSKLEHTLIEQNNKKITDSQIKAFENDYEIVTDSNQKGVHAEVVILSKIVKEQQIKSIKNSFPVYIGISKKCCRGCDTMINAANDVLNYTKIKLPKNEEKYIQIRGSHGLIFEWSPGATFYNGYQESPLFTWTDEGNKRALSIKSKKQAKHAIGFLIGNLTRSYLEKNLSPKEYELLRSGNKPKDLKQPPASMRASRSESDRTDSEEEIEQSKINARKVQLEQLLNFMQDQAKNVTMKDTIRKINIAIMLYDIEKFILLDKVTKEGINKEEIYKTFIAILKLVNEKIDQKINEKELLEILKEKFLVGEKNVEYFLALYEENKSDSILKRKINHIFKEAKEYWEELFEYDEDFEFKKAIEDSLKDDKEFNEQKKYLQTFGNVKDVAHDGFCLFHAVAEQIREKKINVKNIKPEDFTTNKLLMLVEKYLEENWQEYKNSLIGETDDDKYVNLLAELEKYLRLGNYNQNLADLMPTILSKALNISIEIYDATSRNKYLNGASQNQVITLGRVKNNHYMIIDNQPKNENKKVVEKPTPSNIESKTNLEKTEKELPKKRKIEISQRLEKQTSQAKKAKTLQDSFTPQWTNQQKKTDKKVGKDLDSSKNKNKSSPSSSPTSNSNSDND